MNFAVNQGNEIRLLIRALGKKSIFQFLQDFNESSKPGKSQCLPFVHNFNMLCRFLGL